MKTFAIDMEDATKKNANYREVIYTDENIQIVLMGLVGGEDIPFEIHDGTQFIRVESGCGLAIVNGKEYILRDGDSITIPPRHEHYVKNDSEEILQLYSIYSPPEHPPDTLQEKQW
jgi:mannose-6-phosphate isomerase-like protein (cupin superfamily)